MKVRAFIATYWRVGVASLLIVGALAEGTAQPIGAAQITATSGSQQHINPVGATGVRAHAEPSQHYSSKAAIMADVYWSHKQPQTAVSTVSER